MVVRFKLVELTFEEDEKTSLFRFGSILLEEVNVKNVTDAFEMFYDVLGWKH